MNSQDKENQPKINAWTQIKLSKSYKIYELVTTAIWIALFGVSAFIIDHNCIHHSILIFSYSAFAILSLIFLVQLLIFIAKQQNWNYFNHADIDKIETFDYIILNAVFILSFVLYIIAVIIASQNKMDDGCFYLDYLVIIYAIYYTILFFVAIILACISLNVDTNNYEKIPQNAPQDDQIKDDIENSEI